MSRLSVPTRRKLTHTISRRLPDRYRRDDSGLTTLEWLLIVAAVAGMAALAVVLVTRVVGDTSEQIAGQSARKTAAIFAADEIIKAADRSHSDQPRGAKKYGEWKTYYTDKCERLELVYVDIELQTAPTFTNHGTAADDDDVSAGAIEVAANPEADAPTAPTNGAVAHCKVE